MYKMATQVEDVVVEVEDDNDVIISIVGSNNKTNIVLFSPGASITTSTGDVITNGEIESNGETLTTS